MIGTLVTWIHTTRRRNGLLNRTNRGFGPYRAVLDISEAIFRELGGHINAYSNNDIEKALRKRSPVKYGITKNGPSEKGEEDTWHLGISPSPGTLTRVMIDGRKFT